MSVIKETATGTSLHVIAEKLSRHAETVRRFLRDLSTMKKRSDCGTSKTVRAKNFRIIIRKSRGKPGQTSEDIYTGAWLAHVLKTTRNHPRVYGFRTSALETAFFNSRSQEFDAPVNSEVRNQGDSWWTWRLDKQLGIFRRWSSPMFTTSMEESCWGIVSMETEVLTQSWWLQLLIWSQLAYCHFLNEVLDTCRDDILLSLLKTLVSIHENALSQYARVAQTILGSFFIKGERLVVWPLSGSQPYR